MVALTTRTTPAANRSTESVERCFFSHSAVTRLVGQLEAHFGVRLFHRTTRRLALTEEGRQFLNAAQPGLAALRRAIQGARRGREEMAGPLRIAAPRSNWAHVLWPLIAARSTTGSRGGASVRSGA